LYFLFQLFKPSYLRRIQPRVFAQAVKRSIRDPDLSADFLDLGGELKLLKCEFKPLLGELCFFFDTTSFANKGNCAGLSKPTTVRFYGVSSQAVKSAQLS
jgi:hypothetical protein